MMFEIQPLFLHASVPELPNLFVFINKIFGETSVTRFLEHWASVICSMILALGISWIFHKGSKNMSMIPGNLQNALEWIIETIRDTIVDMLGSEGKQYVPFLGTLFIYILAMNWLVLIPFFMPPSASFNVTLGIALAVFVYVQYLNVRNYGIKGFIYHMAGSPKNAVGWVLAPMMFCIELLTQLTRPFTLALRLFGNIFGEDILIATFSLFGVAALAYFNAPIGLPFQVPFLFLALFTGLLQALVFTYLSTIYILLSIPSAEEHI